MSKISKRNRIMLRSLWVTGFMLICAGVCVTAMGHVYAVVEKNAFGHESAAFSVTEMDYINIFGKEVYFPVMSVVLKATEYIKLYCPGTVKLLGVIVNGTEELICNLLN